MKEYFNFNKKDRNAIILLLLIIISLGVWKFYTASHSATNNDLLIQPTQKIEFKKQAFSEKENDEKVYSSKENQAENLMPNTIEITIHQAFDPNNCSFEDWKNIGLPEKFCKTISHFQQKGGKFYKADDLKKVWGMKTEWFEKIAPFVKINEAETKHSSMFTSNENHFVLRKKSIIELNTADSLQLDSLPLIGMKTANRIIKYRNLLGGFYSVEQLHEVWGIRDSMILINLPRFTVNNTLLKKMNINSASVDELKKHPYIKYNKANSIVNYRKQHGNYSQLDDLKNTKMFTDAELEKLKPYISW